MSKPLLVTITFVFDAIGASLVPFADRLIAEDGVATIRLGEEGRPSVIRVDVEFHPDLERVADEALQPLERTARAVGATYRVASVLVEQHDPAVPMTRRSAVWRRIS